MKSPNFKKFCIKLYIYYVALGLEQSLCGAQVANFQKISLIWLKIGKFDKTGKKGGKKVTAAQNGPQLWVFAFSWD